MIKRIINSLLVTILLMSFIPEEIPEYCNNCGKHQSTFTVDESDHINFGYVIYLCECGMWFLYHPYPIVEQFSKPNVNNVI